MPVDAVIFDLDGTLADTVQDIAAAANHVLAVHGMPPHEIDHYHQAVGDGAAVLMERIVPADRVAEAAELLPVFRGYYLDHMLDHSRPYEGIAALLATLVERGTPLAVLSNKPDEMTRGMAQALFSAVPFRAVLGQRPERPKKPDPTVALELASVLGVQPSRCAFVGDTPVDMQTALGAGMVPVGVSWGFRPAAELRAHGAERVLERPAELLALLPGGAAPPSDLR